MGGSSSSADRPCIIVAIDTATDTALVALGLPDGSLVAVETWMAGYRHGEELLVRLEAILRSQAVALASVCGIVVGTGPGAFTGLRVGLATAKGLAHGLGRPIVGVSTGAALLESARRGGVPGPLALLMPAGPNDRVLVTPAPAPAHGHASALRLAAGEEPLLPSGTTIVALDLAGRAPSEAVALGEVARAGFAAALVTLGAARLAAADADDAATLVPEYVTLPRGVARAEGRVTVERA